MIDNSINAGPRAQNGFALQRNAALFLLLDNYYLKFKDEKYFICLEHHDDFLFCFLDAQDNAKSIEAYQSKKKSTSNWSIDAALAEILLKLLGTGEKLLNDSIPKTKCYSHHLYFSTNTTVSLEDTKSKQHVSINEENNLVAFRDLDVNLKDKIKGKLKANLTPNIEKELDNLHFVYVEFTRTDKEQQNQLVGKLEEVFKEDITDYRAAINTLIILFRGIETTYNQGNQAKLLDISKRVSSEEINKTFKIITTKSKAFDFWRNEVRNITSTLNILPSERDIFKMYFETAFDLFKSSVEAEHQKILKFVKHNYYKCTTTQQEENVLELFQQFRNNELTTLSDLNLKAIIYAAYFEVS